MKNERYYYGIMSAAEKEAYKKIFYALKAKALNIEISTALSPDDIQELYLRVLVDNPLFYFINQQVIKMRYCTGYYILMPEYLYNPREITLLDQDVRNMVNKVCTSAKRVAKNDFRLEKYLHDSVVKSVAYDYDSLRKKDCYNAHSIIGAFIDRRAVCEGIAKAFKVLCNECGIKCIVVLGKADPEGVYGEDTYHAWNIVKIGSDSYHVDPTWDNMYDKGFEHISYDYFNLTTADILRDHHPMGRLPECTSTRLNYYACTGSFAGHFDDLVALINARIDRKAIMCKIINDTDEPVSVDELRYRTALAVSEALKNKQLKRSFSVIVNPCQQTVKILFID